MSYLFTHDGVPVALRHLSEVAGDCGISYPPPLPAESFKPRGPEGQSVYRDRLLLLLLHSWLPWNRRTSIRWGVGLSVVLTAPFERYSTEGN